MGQVTLRNTKGTPLTYTEVDNNFKFCDSDTNLIINGGLNIWQRDNTFTSVANGTYTADRFRAAKSATTAAWDVLRSTDVPTQAQAGVKANYSLHVDVTTADASIAANDLAATSYRIEGYDYAQVEGNTYTLSFWVKGTKTGVHCVSFRNSGTDRSYVAEYTINSTATWEKKTISVTFDYSGGTWDYTNGVGIIIDWALAAGSTFQTTADAWQTGNFIATSNQVNVTDSASNDFRLALVKFEPGVEATQFRFRSIAEELSYCSRYYEKSFDLDTAVGTVTSVGQIIAIMAKASTDIRGLKADFSVRMRTTPTMVWYSPNSGISGRVFNATTAADVAVSSTSTPSQKYTGSPTVGSSMADQDEIRASWSADAEL